MTDLHQANTLKREIIFLSRIITSVIGGQPIALDIKRALIRLNSLLDSLVVLKHRKSEEVNSVLESDDIHRSLGCARDAINQALSSPVLMARPKIRAHCKNVVEHLSEILH